MQSIINRGRRISLLFYFAHNCAHLRTISHHFLHIKLYDVIRKSIVFIRSVPRFIRGAFFNTKLNKEGMQMAMPGGNPKNLIVPTSEQARINGAKGGRASANKKKLLKSFRELDVENTSNEERMKMLAKVKQMAERGNLNAIKLYLEIIGEYEININATADMELNIKIDYGEE